MPPKKSAKKPASRLAARRRFAREPKKKREADRRKTAKHTTKYPTAQWMRDPSFGDVQGIDTMSKKYRKKKKKSD